MKVSAPLAALLLATVAVSAWLAAQGDADGALSDAVAARTPGAPPRPASLASTTASEPRSSAPRRAAEPPVGSADLFAARPAWPALDPAGIRAWEVAEAPAAAPPPMAAPPAVTAVTPPSPPQAPPFPYALIGRFEDAGGARALLSNALRTISVAPGELIDGQWRVETVRTGSLDLTWMPGGLRQTIAYRPS